MLAERLIEASGLNKRRFKLLGLSNPRSGESRHFFCTKQVPDEIINRLNASIDVVP